MANGLMQEKVATTRWITDSEKVRLRTLHSSNSVRFPNETRLRSKNSYTHEAYLISNRKRQTKGLQVLRSESSAVLPEYVLYRFLRFFFVEK